MNKIAYKQYRPALAKSKGRPGVASTRTMMTPSKYKSNNQPITFNEA